MSGASWEVAVSVSLAESQKGSTGKVWRVRKMLTN